jgi:Cdc6-like AAA superfamily ATPase
MKVLRSQTEETKKTSSDLLLSTHNFNRVQAVCRDAYNNSKMIAITGEPGYGKTTALSHFKKTNANVYYFSVKPSMTHINFWGSIHAELNRVPIEEIHSPRGLHYLIRKVVGFFKDKEKSLLILDEAGKFNAKMLELIHELRDDTKTNTGIIMAGPNYFKSNLEKWVQKQKIGMPEVMRRINYWEQLYAPDKSEMRNFCEYYGATDYDVIKRITQESKNFGDLHNKLIEHLSK